MTRALADRLRDVKARLDRADAALSQPGTRLSTDVADEFRKMTAFAGDIDHVLAMMETRAAGRQLLRGLETRADDDDLVSLGSFRVKFQHARLLGVQAYLATAWALADRLTAMAGRILCTTKSALDTSHPIHLVNDFVNLDRKKNTAGALVESIRQTFGWPIAIG